jgi:hypothetical protein
MRRRPWPAGGYCAMREERRRKKRVKKRSSHNM